MAIRLYFLGTAGGTPIPGRNLSALALQFDQCGTWDLFDCGEGTQQQLQLSPFSLPKLRRIFISHLHGDHWFGLPGILSSRSMMRAEQPLDIYGPLGLVRALGTVLEVSGAELSYDLAIHEIKQDGQVIDGERDRITAIELSHSITSYAYVVHEHDKPGVFKVAEARRLGVPEGPLYGRLQRGETIGLPDGRLVDGTQLLGPGRPGQKIIIAGDNDRPRLLLKVLEGAQLLVHEATHTDELMAAQETEYRHSTARRVAQVAEATKLPNLILTHFSARFGSRPENRSIDEIRQEAETAFSGNVFLAEDHAEFELRPNGSLRKYSRG